MNFILRKLVQEEEMFLSLYRNFQHVGFFFSDGLTALSFSISSLTVIGMLAAITYTVSCYANVSAFYIDYT